MLSSWSANLFAPLGGGCHAQAQEPRPLPGDLQLHLSLLLRVLCSFQGQDPNHQIALSLKSNPSSPRHQVRRVGSF